MEPVIEEFAGIFLFLPLRPPLLVDRTQDRIRISSAGEVTPDDVSRILTDLKSDV
jgi:hypothetical protein